VAFDRNKAKDIENRYEEIMSSLADPAVLADPSRYTDLSKQLAQVEPAANKIREEATHQRELMEAHELLTHAEDEAMRELAREEIRMLETELEVIEAELADLLTERDPNDEKSVIVEIRAGAGGEEAALFVSDLYKMYTAYAISKGWSTEFIDANETEIGGYRELVFSVEGSGAFSRFKFESGVHRVQRVPVTESGGRVHTSTVTVAVLPEVSEVEVNINPNELRIDTFRASGAGGQHINRTDSAIRITHLPTGLVVTCQDERSQYKNKAKAMTVLQSRLLEMEKEAQHGKIAQERKSQVGTGDRSERIRTYNYHQGRVTDHRIGLTLYRLSEVLAGDLDEFITALSVADRTDSMMHGEADE